MINYREKVMTLEGVTNFKEIKTEEDFTCTLTFNNIPFRQVVKYIPQVEKFISIYELYYYLYKNLTIIKQEREVRRAFSNAWFNNIINNKADDRGEFIPSNKQIIDELKKESGQVTVAIQNGIIKPSDLI